MSPKKNWARGLLALSAVVSLCLAFGITSTASAQGRRAPAQRPAAGAPNCPNPTHVAGGIHCDNPTPQPPPAPQQTAGDAQGDCSQAADALAVTRDTTTGRLRAPHNGEFNTARFCSRNGQMSAMQAIVADGQATQQEAQAIATENRHQCRVTGATVRLNLFILDAVDGVGGTGGFGHELDGLRAELVPLGQEQLDSYHGRTGGIAGSTINNCFAFLLACPGQAASGVGQQMTSTAYQHSNQVALHQSDEGARQSQVSLLAQLANSQATIDWAVTYQDFCLVAYRLDTLGTGGITPELLARLRDHPIVDIVDGRPNTDWGFWGPHGNTGVERFYWDHNDHSNGRGTNHRDHRRDRDRDSNRDDQDDRRDDRR